MFSQHLNRSTAIRRKSSGYRHPRPFAICGKAVELLKEMEEAEGRLETLLQEAEDSGPATEMTAQDWGGHRKRRLKEAPVTQVHLIPWLA